MRDFLCIEGGFQVQTVIPEKEAEGIKYKDYFDWEEPVAPRHPTGFWP